MRRLVVGLLAMAAGLAALSGCEPSEGRYISLGYFDPATDLTTNPDVVYGEAPALPDGSMPPGGVETLLLDVVMPKRDLDAETARPVVVWIHGGGFKAGSKSSAQKWLKEWASRGYVAVGINYRLDQDNRCQDIQDGRPVPPGEQEQCFNAIVAAQHDAQAAVRWVRANAGSLDADPEGIVAMGSSAGAVTSLNMAYNAHDPGASNDLPGSSGVRAVAALSGAAYPEIAQVGAGDAPAVYAHCTNDQAVDWGIAEAGITRARAAGLVADLLLWQPPESCAPGRTHGVDLMLDHRAEIDLAFTQFFYRHLGLSQVED
jgi:acetyl esterase/lipase